MKLALKTIGYAIFSISVLVSFGLTSNQAFAGNFEGETCESCQKALDACDPGAKKCISFWQSCLDQLMCRSAVGGEFIGIETTSVLAAGAQYTAAWMIPVIVSGIGFAIVIARKF